MTKAFVLTEWKTELNPYLAKAPYPKQAGVPKCAYEQVLGVLDVFSDGKFKKRDFSILFRKLTFDFAVKYLNLDAAKANWKTARAESPEYKPHALIDTFPEDLSDVILDIKKLKASFFSANKKEKGKSRVKSFGVSLYSVVVEAVDSYNEESETPIYLGEIYQYLFAKLAVFVLSLEVVK